MVQLIGRITKDAKVTELKDEKKVVNFSIALNDSHKSKGGEVVKHTTFVNCAYWVNPANAAYLTKGTLIEVNGRLSVNAYVNLSGEAVGNIHFHVDKFKLHGGGSGRLDATGTETNTAGTTPRRTTKAQPAAEITEPMDDLPF